MPEGASRGHARRGLFLRIFSAYVLTALVFAVATGVIGFQLARSYGPDWYGPILEQVDEQAGPIAEHLDNPRRLEKLLAPLERETDTHIQIVPRPTGPGALRKLPVPLSRAEIQQLRHDQPIVHRRGRKTPQVVWRLRHPDTDRIVAFAIIEPKHLRGRFVVWAGLLGLLILGTGSWLVTRGLTRRLERLQRSAREIAAGNFSTRAEIRDVPGTDEIDDLGVAFNTMAGDVERLLRGQRVLLANVSHELRTPVARVKVLLEILEAKVDKLRRAAPGEDPTIERLGRGLIEMSEDIAEMETLIADLLTSGRLELGKDGAGLDRRRTEIAPLLHHAADRFGAVVVCPADLEHEVDELLIERLLRNLLSNARRHSPDGAIAIIGEALRGGRGGVRLAVEDEGPGVPEEHREVIFEPFHRLDAARNRDAGGVGLGLHLCRQIARAHGGDIHVEDRRDGASGARFVVTLPPDTGTD